jgi:hypothetical protein
MFVYVATGGTADEFAFHAEARHVHWSVLKSDGQPKTGRISPVRIEAPDSKVEAAAHTASAEGHLADSLFDFGCLCGPFHEQTVHTVSDG